MNAKYFNYCRHKKRDDWRSKKLYGRKTSQNEDRKRMKLSLLKSVQ